MQYCPVCGIEVSSPADTRFAHAEAFVETVQAGRVQAAGRALQSADTEQQPNTLRVGAPKPRDWKHYIKMGACIAAPVLALVFVAGGGGAVLGWAGAVLPVLAILAGDHQNRGEEK